MALSIPPYSWQPPYVSFETSMGPFVVELYWYHAPLACKNFAELARRGYYNGCVFFRIIRDFIIQSGDPTGTGRSRVSIFGQVFVDEIHPELKFTGAGIVATASSGPNTNCAQFFITLAPTPVLDGKNTIFGRIKSGLAVIRKIGLVDVRDDERPVDPVPIISSRVLEL